MTVNRDKDADRAATGRHLINSIATDRLPYSGDDEHGKNWLGHTKGARALDMQLLDESTMDELIATSNRTAASIKNHFLHLKVMHGIDVERYGDLYRLKINNIN